MKALSNKEINKKTETPSKIYGDYLIMLAAPLLLAVWFYGARAISVVATSVISAVLTDLIFCAFLRRRFLLKDLSSIFIGIAIALMLPAGVPYYVPASAAFFAVAAVKIPFGGSMKTPFVPAAAGFAFASVSFKDAVFDYSYNSADMLLGQRSLGAMLSQGNAVHLDAINTFDIISGNVAGPMGAGCGLLMIACLVFLIFRRKEAVLPAVSFILTSGIYAAIFPRINASSFTSVFLELSAGSLLFVAVFLLTDYSTVPKNILAKIIYGAVCGIFCMLMRTVGTYEEAACFAVLMANGFSPVIQSLTKRIPSLGKKSVASAGREAKNER